MADEWVQLDLDSVRSVTGVRICKAADQKNEYVTQVQVDVSEDGTSFTCVFTSVANLTYMSDGASDVDFSDGLSDGDDIVIVASTAPRISPPNPGQKLLASPDPRPRSLETNRLPCNASAPHTPG